MSLAEKQKQSYLTSVLNVLNEAVFVYDENMKIKHFNAAAETITGFKKEDVIGKQCVTLFDKNLCLNNCELCLTVKNGQAAEAKFQSPFTRKDGAMRYGEFKVDMLGKDNKGGLEVLVSLTDITELVSLKRDIKGIHSFRNIIGKSARMQDLYKSLQNFAQFDSTILIYGESGTGKELAVKALHYESPRADKKLVKVNCSSFSENLLESELFGHVKGAFTGAVRHRVGRFEEADGGTLFLDEIGDLSARVQVKLLRVLQEKEIERVGENFTRKVDIRIIAATNKDLMREVREGRFREDLFYRLNVIPITMPPLRERKEDIRLLVNHFIQTWRGREQKPVSGISGQALGRLMDHGWPGNVRELENAIEHACVKCAKDSIEASDLPAYLIPAMQERRRPAKKRKWLTKKLVTEALRECGHNQTQAANQLGIHRITLWRKMRDFKITAKPAPG